VYVRAGTRTRVCVCVHRRARVCAYALYLVELSILGIPCITLMRVCVCARARARVCVHACVCACVYVCARLL